MFVWIRPECFNKHVQVTECRTFQFSYPIVSFLSDRLISRFWRTFKSQRWRTSTKNTTLKWKTNVSPEMMISVWLTLLSWSHSCSPEDETFKITFPPAPHWPTVQLYTCIMNVCPCVCLTLCVDELKVQKSKQVSLSDRKLQKPEQREEGNETRRTEPDWGQMLN